MKKIEFDLQSQEAAKLPWLLGNGQVVLLTCCNAEKTINGIIAVSWMTPTSHEPLLFSVSVGSGGKETGDKAYRVCYSLINETKEFGLNVTTNQLAETILKIGTTHSNEIDKFSETGLTPLTARKISAPLIAECFMNIECKVINQFATGDHTVFVAEPVAVIMDNDVMVNGIFTEKYRNKMNQPHLGDFITMGNMW